MNNKIKDKIVETGVSIQEIADLLRITTANVEHKILFNLWNGYQRRKLAKLFNCKKEDLI